MLRRSSSWSDYFTLVELLVVIAIISILASLLLPTLQSALEMAADTQCLNQQRQSGVAVQLYSSDYNEVIPPSNQKIRVGSWDYEFGFGWFLHKGDYLQNLRILTCPKTESRPIRETGGYPTGYGDTNFGLSYTPNIFAFTYIKPDSSLWLPTGSNKAKSGPWLKLSTIPMPSKMFLITETLIKWDADGLLKRRRWYCMLETHHPSVFTNPDGSGIGYFLHQNGVNLLYGDLHVDNFATLNTSGGGSVEGSTSNYDLWGITSW